MTAARLRTTVRIDHDVWRSTLPTVTQVTRKATQSGWAIGRKGLADDHPLSKALTGPVEISVLLSDDATVRGLNHTHLGKDKPTNVLSFPGDLSNVFPEADILLGDIILAWETIEKEANAEEKAISEHLSHLVIHGVLHLLGYDHECEEDAKVMESLEVDCMARLGLADPYVAGDRVT